MNIRFAAEGVSESVLATANAVAAVLFMLAAIWLTVVEYKSTKKDRTQKQ